MKIEIKNTYTDEQLVDFIVLDGKSEFFSFLYKKYQLIVYKKCLAITKNVDVSEELTQDILCKVFDILKEFKKQSTFSTWLYSIIYHECINYLRSSKKISHQIYDIEDTDEEDDIELIELEDLKVSRLDEVLNLLPALDKAILLMKYQEGFKLKQIQEILNLTESTTKMRIKRAKIKVLKLYNDLYSK
jgi:RNA polymerase sigma-70 factor (ECF subfamily)